jgi:hypothetical protein
MVNTATVVPKEQHFILSSLSPTRAQRRLALAVVLALLAAYFITEGLLSTIQLRRREDGAANDDQLLFGRMNERVGRSMCLISTLTA